MSLIDFSTPETYGSGQTGDLPIESHPRRVLEGLRAAAYVTDANGNVTCYNAAAVELWGRQPRLCQDRWCGSWRLYWPDGSPLPLDQCPMATALKEKRPVRGLEVVAERPDGTRVPFIAFPTPLYDVSGKLSGGVNMLIDITHRTVAEEQMQELEAKLDTLCVVLAGGESAPVRDAPGALT
jgi:PAS domain S-box-containing protein